MEDAPTHPPTHPPTHTAVNVKDCEKHVDIVSIQYQTVQGLTVAQNPMVNDMEQKSKQ